MKMNFIKIRKLFNLHNLSFILFFAGIFFLRSSFIIPKSQPDKKILAKIGDKKISVKEFLQRSELTVRPANFKDKNTTLNNLISEKLLAMEAGNDNKLLNSKIFQARLKGIKEQLMRDQLYYDVAFNKVELDSGEIKNAFRMSLREYDLEFYTINNDSLKNKVEEKIKLSLKEEEALADLENTLGKKPTHKVNFMDDDDQIIHDALFSALLDTGSVLGPIKISNGDYIVMKVQNWTDNMLISGYDRLERWNEVKKKLHQARANKMWQSFISDIWVGKKIEFNKETFNTLSDIAVEFYLNQLQQDSLNLQLNEIPASQQQIDTNAPFLTLDNKTWTVNDIKNEFMSHPLVFRTKNVNRNNFKRQFQMAIVDLLRDRYLTQEAYSRSLDKSDGIEGAVEMWKDAYLATDQEKNILNTAINQGLFDKNNNSEKLKYWENYLTGLQNKYSSSIYIDFEGLQKLKLTNIDLVAFRPGIPYPIAMPMFPTFISSDNLKYAKNQK